MNPEDLGAIAALIRGQRQAALGTLRHGAPHLSMVAYAEEPDFGGFLLHLSRLAAHTQQLLADSRASLLVCEPDDQRNDVQTLARLTIIGLVMPLMSASYEYEAARRLYLAKLPAAAPLFGFPDFALYRFAPSEAHYVGGFARAFALTADGLRATSQLEHGRPSAKAPGRTPI
jgi:hypothetical protein